MKRALPCYGMNTWSWHFESHRSWLCDRVRKTSDPLKTCHVYDTLQAKDHRTTVLTSNETSELKGARLSQNYVPQSKYSLNFDEKARRCSFGKLVLYCRPQCRFLQFSIFRFHIRCLNVLNWESAVFDLFMFHSWWMWQNLLISYQNNLYINKFFKIRFWSIFYWGKQLLRNYHGHSFIFFSKKSKTLKSALCGRKRNRQINFKCGYHHVPLFTVKAMHSFIHQNDIEM